MASLLRTMTNNTPNVLPKLYDISAAVTAVSLWPVMDLQPVQDVPCLFHNDQWKQTPAPRKWLDLKI